MPFAIVSAYIPSCRLFEPSIFFSAVGVLCISREKPVDNRGQPRDFHSAGSRGRGLTPPCRSRLITGFSRPAFAGDRHDDPSCGRAAPCAGARQSANRAAPASSRNPDMSTKRTFQPSVVKRKRTPRLSCSHEDARRRAVLNARPRQGAARPRRLTRAACSARDACRSASAAYTAQFVAVTSDPQALRRGSPLAVDRRPSAAVRGEVPVRFGFTAIAPPCAARRRPATPPKRVLREAARPAPRELDAAAPAARWTSCCGSKAAVPIARRSAAAAGGGAAGAEADALLEQLARRLRGAEALR